MLPGPMRILAGEARERPGEDKLDGRPSHRCTRPEGDVSKRERPYARHKVNPRRLRRAAG